MQIIQGQYNTAKVFATTIEESCKRQILELCDESWTKDSKIRIMADCHSGKGCVIGTTVSIIDKCVPNMVGVDIGCGMLTTKFRSIKLDLKIVDDIIKCNIPLGFHRNDAQQQKRVQQLAEQLVSDFFEIDETLTESNPNVVIR